MGKNVITTLFEKLKITNPSRNEKAGYFLMHDAETDEVCAVPEAAILAKVNSRIDGIIYPDGFTKTTEINRVGNTVTIAPGDFEWRIQLNPYANADEYTKTFDPTESSELKRIDTLATTTDGTIVYHRGEEDEFFVKPPRIPTNQLRLSDFSIFGDDVQEHTEPIVSEVYTLAEKEKLAILDPTADIDKPVSTAQAAADAATLVTANSYTDSSVSGKQDNLTDANVGAFESVVPTISTIADTDKVPLLIGSLRRMITWANFKALFKTVGGNSIFGSGDISVGSGDMTTNTDQNVSGIKTFFAGKFGLRNTANTFTSFFASAVTASRTWTWPDKNGTVAMTSDITSVINAGTTNYLAKYVGSTIVGISRLWDTGTFLGIGAAKTPTKDITLGNQANREIGVEESNNTSHGRDLIVTAGRTINYVESSLFLPLNQTIRNYLAIECHVNGNVYVGLYSGGIHMQTAGSGDFADTGLSGNYYDFASHASGDMYGINGTTITKQTAGIGSFVAVSGLTARSYSRIDFHSNGNMYAILLGVGDIYMRTGGAGDLVALGQTARGYTDISCHINGNVYACVSNGDIYMQTGGAGNFVGLGQSSRQWQSLDCHQNGNVYANAKNGDIYMQTNGLGNFVLLQAFGGDRPGLSCHPNGNVYISTYGPGDIYMQQNNGAGSADLNGGTLKLKAGTGKGTGQSRFQIITGQKTVSGTDMQVETVRVEFDENGNYKRIGTPVYADNTAALAGGLTAGMEYRTSTGLKMEVY